MTYHQQLVQSVPYFCTHFPIKRGSAATNAHGLIHKSQERRSSQSPKVSFLSQVAQIFQVQSATSRYEAKDNDRRVCVCVCTCRSERKRAKGNSKPCFTGSTDHTQGFLTADAIIYHNIEFIL